MSRDVIAPDLMGDDTPHPAIGSRVQLNRHVYGHRLGAQGVVLRGPRAGNVKVLVRFDDTGYQILVPREALNAVA